jgi:hypothetical protein
MNQTDITIRRGKSYADRLRAYKVEIDGAVVATVRAGQSATVPVTVGRHTLTLRIDWCSSEKLQFDAQSGDHIAFECGSSLTGARLLLAIVYIFRPNQWLWLRRTA